jgi:hypothetical protein
MFLCIVFCARERKNDTQKNKSTALPKAEC